MSLLSSVGAVLKLTTTTVCRRHIAVVRGRGTLAISRSLCSNKTLYPVSIAAFANNNNNNNSNKFQSTLSFPRFDERWKQQRRHMSVSSKEGSSNNDGDSSSGSKENEPLGSVDPQYAMIYTCNVCDTRSSQTFSKKAYHEGVVIVTCPGCKNNHLVADHLNWFDHIEGRTIEEILASKGEAVSKIGGANEGGVTQISLDDLNLLSNTTSNKTNDNSNNDTSEGGNGTNGSDSDK
eukprot:m.240677 g.240677  ORF g.240677 m.240677 type:complete len:235 (+) comp15742_c0_seq1:41-745(+)